MKKVIISIIALFYLLISSGVTLHAHYCMGNLVELKAPWGNDDCNKKDAPQACHMSGNEMPFCCAGDKEDPSCCDEEIFQIQLTIPALGSSAQIVDFKLIEGITQSNLIAFDFVLPEFTKSNIEFYRPPPILRDIRIIIQSLLFYH